MFKNKKVTAVVLAAGSANRMNLNINKVYLSLNEQRVPVLHYPLAAFEANPYVDEIVIVIRSDDREIIRGMMLHEKFPRKPVRIVEGGRQRYDSVYNALEKVSGDIVIVHDGARPFLKQQYINDCIEMMADEVAVAVAIPLTDSWWFVDKDGMLQKKVDNAGMYRVQTPQCFHTSVLKKCHETVLDKTNVTDDTALLEECGYRVKLIKGGETNIKLTFQDDIITAEKYILNDQEINSLL